MSCSGQSRICLKCRTSCSCWLVEWDTWTSVRRTGPVRSRLQAAVATNPANDAARYDYLRALLAAGEVAAARQAYDTGISMLRPMYYDYPEAPEAYEFKDQYMFGDALLVAPVSNNLVLAYLGQSVLGMPRSY